MIRRKAIHPFLRLVPVLMLVWLFPQTARAEDPQDPQDPCAALRQEIQALRKTIAALEDTNNLFVENLANCAEENLSLAERLEGSPNPVSAAEEAERQRLIDLLRRRLSCDDPLIYLHKLNPDELEALIAAVEKGCVSEAQRAP